MDCPLCGALGGTVHKMRCPRFLAYNWRIVSAFCAIGLIGQLIWSLK